MSLLNLEKKKVMITGISGFLGYHVSKEFVQAGYDVIGVDKRPLPEEYYKPSKFIQTDIFDLTFRDLMGIDYIVHLAWRTNIPDCIRHPEKSTYQNIDMTMHLIQVAKEAGVKKFVFPSTASLYASNKTPWTEDMAVSPIEPYSWQKMACEALCKMYGEELPYAIPRFFQIFGEHQREDTALAAFIRLKKAGQKITLTETMAQSKFKSAQRDFLYAGDLAGAVRILAEGDDTGIYNVCSGEVKTMEDIANAVEADVEWIPRRSYEVERHEGNIDKIKALNWKAKVDVLKWLKLQI